MQYAIDRPTLVEQALQLAADLSFDVRPEGNSDRSDSDRPSCCIDEMGSLLRALSASVDCGVVGEIGAGAGVGTAWLASGLRSSSNLLAVEIDARLVAGVQSLFAGHSQVKVLVGDWRAEFSTSGPFDLLFADGGGVGNLAPNKWTALAELVKPGGILAMDDLTPEEYWPDSWKGIPDPKRELAFRSGLFVATEVRLRPDISALIMCKK